MLRLRSRNGAKRHPASVFESYALAFLNCPRMNREIKEQLADQVIDRASQSLRTQMTQDDHKRVVVRFIKNL